MKLFPAFGEKKFFSIEEVARLFEITVQGVHVWLRKKRITNYARTSRKGKYLVPKREVVRLLKLSNRAIPGLWVPNERVMKKVLLIDDYEPIRRMVEKAFENPSFRVDLIAVENVVDGLMIMAKCNPEVIVMDYFFAKDRIQGDLALAFIRKAKAMKGVRVIGMSGYRGVGPKMLKAGADDFLLKPFGLEELKNTIFRCAFGDRRKSDRRRPLVGVVSDRVPLN